MVQAPGWCVQLLLHPSPPLGALVSSLLHREVRRPPPMHPLSFPPPLTSPPAAAVMGGAAWPAGPATQAGGSARDRRADARTRGGHSTRGAAREGRCVASIRRRGVLSPPRTATLDPAAGSRCRIPPLSRQHASSYTRVRIPFGSRRGTRHCSSLARELTA